MIIVNIVISHYCSMGANVHYTYSVGTENQFVSSGNYGIISGHNPISSAHPDD